MGLWPAQADEKLLLLVLLSVPNRIVIPTGAYPDFLPRCTE
jgi:hypothetical protein